MDEKKRILLLVGVTENNVDTIYDIKYNFNVDWEENDFDKYSLNDAVSNKNLGNVIISELYKKIIKKVLDELKYELGFSVSDYEEIEKYFDYYVNDLDTHFYFNNENYNDYDSLLTAVTTFLILNKYAKKEYFENLMSIYEVLDIPFPEDFYCLIEEIAFDDSKTDEEIKNEILQLINKEYVKQ